MKRLVIIGAGGHGKVVAECAVRNGYENIIFLDDDRNLRTCGRYPVVGTAAEFPKFRENGDADPYFFVAVGAAPIRQRIQEEIENAGGKIAVLIHPDAVIGDDVEIGAGTVIMAGTVINTGAVIGTGCIINTAASVDHDCCIGDFVHIAVGAHVAGSVNIGAKTWIGAGAVVSNNVDICGECMVGAGAVVVENIDVMGTYVGVPARMRGSI